MITKENFLPDNDISHGIQLKTWLSILKQLSSYCHLIMQYSVVLRWTRRGCEIKLFSYILAVKKQVHATFIPINIF